MPSLAEAEVSDRLFGRFQELILRLAGIRLSTDKKALLCGRLSKRLRELRLQSLEEYYYRVTEGGDAAERVRMLDCISTNETRFFREPQQFEFLEQRVFREWRERAERGEMPRRARVWSAACSTGEEPYSLAMLLREHFPPSSGWVTEVLATDLSTRALQRAEDAVWSVEKARDIPEHLLKRYMLRGTGPQVGRMKAGPEIRSMVTFQRVNLNDERYSIGGTFELIFCRNVFIYFDGRVRAEVLARLLGHLSPRGFLFLGSSETLAGSERSLRGVMPSVYQRVAEVRAEDRTELALVP